MKGQTSIPTTDKSPKPRIHVASDDLNELALASVALQKLGYKEVGNAYRISYGGKIVYAVDMRLDR